MDRTQIEAVLFDLFDTLFLLESEEIHYPPSLKKLVEFLNAKEIAVPLESFKQKFTEVVDNTYAETNQSLGEPHFNFYVSKTLESLGYNYDQSSLIVTGATKAFGDEFKRNAHLDPEAYKTLENLHVKYKLGLISNLAVSESAWDLMQESQLKRFFDVIIISGDVNKKKPSPHIFWEALRILNVEAAKAVFIGDNLESDILGSMKAGMLAVHIRRKSVEYSDTVPNVCISGLGELPLVLKKLEISFPQQKTDS